MQGVHARSPYERGKIKIVIKTNPDISRRDNKITFIYFCIKGSNLTCYTYSFIKTQKNSSFLSIHF